MKICWDNLEKLRYVRYTGTFRYRGTSYYYFDTCEFCGHPFLGEKNSRFCDRSCSQMGKNNNFWGKSLSLDHKEKIRKSNSGEKNPMFGKTGINAPAFGRTGDKHPMFGKRAANNKGDVALKNIALYDTYKFQLHPYEKCYHDPKDQSILNVECFKCKNLFRPTRSQVKSRIGGLRSNDTNKFYCSLLCKESCSIYRQHKYPKGNKPYTESREHQHELKIRIYNKDKGICQICGIKVTLEASICHHEIPVAINPLISLDDDNCWTLCVSCDKHAHKLPGCRYSEIRNKKC